MKTIVTTLALFAAVGMTPAFAADAAMSNANTNTDHMSAIADTTHPGMNVDQKFKMIDTNNDGMVSKDEFMSAMDKKFTAMDVNHDGMISKQEMSDWETKEMSMHANNGMMMSK